MRFLWVYPMLAFLIIALSHYFLWLRMPHQFWANEHDLKVSRRVVHEVRWIPYCFGALIVFMSFKLALPPTPLWFDLSVPLTLAFSVKMIGINFAKRKLRKEWLERAFLSWTKDGKCTLTVYFMGTERHLYCEQGQLVFSLAISKHELVPQVLDEFERIYRRVIVRNDHVFVLLGKQPASIAELMKSCSALPEMKSINFSHERESVLVER
ncbi:MAG TPA: hypothetical protein VJ579_05300 [Candidatus Paceibacterota bacterium]|nr:hypothetical protein [Candidatus Paceibacterota bacterium]